MSASSPIGPLSSEELPLLALRELASGIDTLYWSIKAELPAVELERLQAHRAMAEAAGEGVPFLLGGEEFGIKPFGFMGSYRFQLVHPYGRIGVTPSAHLPTVYVQPDGEFLHGVGPRACVDWFNTVVSSLVPGGVARVSRVDVFLDVQGLTLCPEDRKRFVTRAGHRRLFEDFEVLDTLQFGRRGGIHARIYRKDIEIGKSGSVWVQDLWGEDWVPNDPVWRIEFEIHRAVLSQLSIDTVEDLLVNVVGIWGYATDWLSLRIPSADATRSRWPVDPAWEFVKNASLRNGAVGLQRTYDAKRKASLRQIIVVFRGYASSYGALIDEPDADRLGVCLTSLLHEWEIETGNPFSWQVDRKRRKYGLL